jgi:methionine salvage enolase-phosphatase E1
VANQTSSLEYVKRKLLPFLDRKLPLFSRRSERKIALIIKSVANLRDSKNAKVNAVICML